MKKKLIEIEGLNIESERYKGLVKDISFDIFEGEILGMVGESGSGKTLTARSIANLLPEGLFICADKFRVFGMDFLNMPIGEKRTIVGKYVGYVPQNTVFYLHPMYKIKDQIADGYMYHQKASKEEALKHSASVLEKVGFRDTKRLLNSYPWQLSGGMRQRVNIAMAMLNDPRLMIADEPTTALDSTIQKQVMNLFRDINQEMNTSVLVISHDLGLVRHYCHRIIVMYAGRIVETGEKEELFNDPRHPYTKALISVMPSLNIKKDERLSEIPGHVPEAGRDIEGCVFQDRCPYRMESCAKKVKKVYVSDTHYYRCNLEE